MLWWSNVSSFFSLVPECFKNIFQVKCECKGDMKCSLLRCSSFQTKMSGSTKGSLTVLLSSGQRAKLQFRHQGWWITEQELLSGRFVSIMFRQDNHCCLGFKSSETQVYNLLFTVKLNESQKKDTIQCSCGPKMFYKLLIHWTPTPSFVTLG